MDNPTEQQTQTEEPKLLPSPVSEVAQLPPAQEAAAPAKAEQRQKTEKETVLDNLIAKRQSILDRLKAKNPLVLESRKRISSIIPALKGAGSTHTMELIREAERIEFSIATEAYTPKHEKELIKRIREIKTELSKHKELDAARKIIEAERSTLQALLSEIKVLEGELAEVRKQCDVAYSDVLAERKASYEQRQRGREPSQYQREERREGPGPRRRGREDRHEHMDSDMQKYMKDYDDTVSMEEIVIFEKKEKKKEEDAKEE